MTNLEFYAAIAAPLVTGIFAIILLWMKQRAAKNKKHADRIQYADILEHLEALTLMQPADALKQLDSYLLGITMIAASLREPYILQSANTLLNRFHTNNALHAGKASTAPEHLLQELNIWKEACRLLQILLSKILNKLR